MVANVIRVVGTDELKDAMLPGFLRGEVTIALGMTEPEVGPTSPRVRTRARRRRRSLDRRRPEDVHDQRARRRLRVPADPHRSGRAEAQGPDDVPRPLDQPGVEVQAVFTLSGERTNITFYNDVVVEDRWRIGEVDGGWSSLMISLQDEHSAPFGAHLARLSTRSRRGPTRGDGSTIADVEARLGRWATELEVAQLLEQRVTWMLAEDQVPVAEGPMSKLFSTEAAVKAAETSPSWSAPTPCAAAATRPRSPTDASSTPCASRSADDLRRHERDPAQHHRPAGAAASPARSRTRRSGRLLRDRRPPPTLFI